MAVYEQNALTQYKDEKGNMYIVYPITKRECIDGLNDIKTVTLPASGWSDTAPYTQLVAVEGITADDVPLPMLDTRNSSSLDNEKAIKKSYGYLTYFETGKGTITVTAKYQKPTADLTIALKGV